MAEINWGLLDPNSPQKVGNSFYEGQLQAQKLRDSDTQNAIANYQLKQAQRQDENQNALFGSLRAANGDQDKIANAFISAGMPEKAYKAQQELADLNKKKAEAGDIIGKQRSGAFVSIYNDPSDENIIRTANIHAATSGEDASGLAKQLLSIQDLNARKQAIMSVIMQHPNGKDALLSIQAKPEKVDTGGQIGFVNTNPLAGKVGTQLGGSINKVATPGELLTAQTARRGQDMTDARQRELNTITNSQGKVPAGYRQTSDGNLEAIPGGPADVKKQGQLNADTASLQGSMSNFDRLATAANELLNAPGLGGITGIRGAIPNIPGTDAADAEAKLNTLKSQVGFGVLQDMRNNSKTGGALGSVSDAEGKRLEANLAALEKAQSKEQMMESLKKIVDYSQQAKDRMLNAYNMKYKEGGNSQPAQAKKSGPKAGDVEDGYRFKGGDPSNPKSWEKVTSQQAIVPGIESIPTLIKR